MTMQERQASDQRQRILAMSSPAKWLLREHDLTSCGATIRGQPCRQAGLLGSTSVNSTGAKPNKAITAGSVAGFFTPS
jgi:hypothetical protein